MLFIFFTAFKRRALLNEIERLSAEMASANKESSGELSEKGSLTISEITLPLKKSFLERMHKGKYFFFLIY